MHLISTRVTFATSLFACHERPFTVSDARRGHTRWARLDDACESVWIVCVDWAQPSWIRRDHSDALSSALCLFFADSDLPSPDSLLRFFLCVSCFLSSHFVLFCFRPSSSSALSTFVLFFSSFFLTLFYVFALDTLSSFVLGFIFATVARCAFSFGSLLRYGCSSDLEVSFLIVFLFVLFSIPFFDFPPENPL